MLPSTAPSPASVHSTDNVIQRTDCSLPPKYETARDEKESTTEYPSSRKKNSTNPMPNSCTKLPGNNSKLEPTTSESKNAKPQETQKWRNPKARRRDSPPASRKHALPPKRKKGTPLNKINKEKEEEEKGKGKQGKQRTKWL